MPISHPQQARFQTFQGISTPLPHAQLMALPLVFTHAFPGVTVSPSLADGNVPFSSVFTGWGEHGKRSRASSLVPPRAEDPPISPSTPHLSSPKAALLHFPPSVPDMAGNNHRASQKDGARPLQPCFMGRTLNQSDKVSSWVRACRGISALISITLESSRNVVLSANMPLNARGVNISVFICTEQ